MKTKKMLAVVFAASLLSVAACGGGSDNGNDNASDTSGNNTSGASGTSESTSSPSESSSTGGASGGSAMPAEGVPPNTDPLPMPVAGKRYDNPQPRSALKDGGELTLPITEIGPNFNAFSVDGNTLYMNDLWYWTMPNLWNLTVGGKATPNKDYLLSAKLVNESPETVKYVLNPKAKWNNGDPITWKAFETVWKTQNGKTDKYNPASTDGYSSIKSVEKGKKPNIAIVTFGTKFYPWQVLFSTLEPPKNIDPKFYKKGWVNKFHNDLAAGPYIVKSQSKTEITFVPNPKWWGPEPKLDKITYKQMEDTASINAFQNEEVDVTSVGSADRLSQIKDMKNVLVERGFQTSTSVYTLRKYSPFFKEKNARKAFVLGTDRTQLAKIRFQGMNWEEEPPGSELMYPFQDTYEDNMKGLHYDPDAAKKLLDEAGWTMGDDGYRHKDGKTAEIRYVTFSDDPTHRAMARAQQQMMKQIGIKMDIITKKNSEFSKTLTETKDYDVVAMGWSGSDPYGYVYNCQLYCSDSQSNFSGLGNKQLDKQLKKPTTIPDIDKAAHVGNQAEAEALRLFGTFPLYNGPSQYAVTKGLANTQPITGVSGFLTVQPYNVGWMK